MSTAISNFLRKKKIYQNHNICEITGHQWNSIYEDATLSDRQVTEATISPHFFFSLLIYSCRYVGPLKNLYFGIRVKRVLSAQDEFLVWIYVCFHRYPISLIRFVELQGWLANQG